MFITTTGFPQLELFDKVVVWFYFRRYIIKLKPIVLRRVVFVNNSSCIKLCGVYHNNLQHVCTVVLSLARWQLQQRFVVVLLLLTVHSSSVDVKCRWLSEELYSFDHSSVAVCSVCVLGHSTCNSSRCNVLLCHEWSDSESCPEVAVMPHPQTGCVCSCSTVLSTDLCTVTPNRRCLSNSRRDHYLACKFSCTSPWIDWQMSSRLPRPSLSLKSCLLWRVLWSRCSAWHMFLSLVIILNQIATVCWGSPRDLNCHLIPGLNS